MFNSVNFDDERNIVIENVDETIVVISPFISDSAGGISYISDAKDTNLNNPQSGQFATFDQNGKLTNVSPETASGLLSLTVINHTRATEGINSVVKDGDSYELQPLVIPSTDWNDIPDKPSVFPADPTTIPTPTWSEITGKPDEFPSQPNWEDVKNKPIVGDMLKSVYDTDSDGIVDHAKLADNATHSISADSASSATHSTSSDTATSATHATSSDTATSATNSDTVDGKHSSDLADKIHQHPGTDITSVVANANHAVTADTATTAVTAQQVPWDGITGKPNEMLQSTYDANGDGIVDYAQHAVNADTASSATHATSADTATSATNADTVDGKHSSDLANAIHQHPGTDVTSTVANATHSVNSDNATHATSADTATHSTSSDSATNATHSTSSDTATHATSADSATTATTASGVAWNNVNGKPTIGDMLKSTYDANGDGIVDHAALADTATNATHSTSADSATTATTATNADAVPWTGVSGKPALPNAGRWNPFTVPASPSIYDDEFSTGSIDAKWWKWEDHPTTKIAAIGVDSYGAYLYSNNPGTGGWSGFFQTITTLPTSKKFAIDSYMGVSMNSVPAGIGIQGLNSGTRFGRVLSYYHDGTNFKIFSSPVALYNDGLTFSNVFTGAFMNTGMWLRIIVDSSNATTLRLFYYFSTDGITWMTTGSVDNITYTSIDRVGLIFTPKDYYSQARFFCFRTREISSFDQNYSKRIIGEPVYGKKG